MRYAIEVSSAPAVEPLDLVEVKGHCKIDLDDDDDLVESWITLARTQCEDYLDQALITQTLKLYLDEFPEWEICVPRSPVQSITSIVYDATSGTSTTLSASNYRLDAKSRPSRITPSYGNSWPGTRSQTNAVTITYVAGYGASGSSVPPAVLQAMRVAISAWNIDREGAKALPSASLDLLLTVWDGRY